MKKNNQPQKVGFFNAQTKEGIKNGYFKNDESGSK